MRVTIVSVGSRGDVQPHIALSLGLQAAGYTVRLATHLEFEALVRSYGIDFFPLRGNPREVLESESGQALMRSGKNPLRFSRAFQQLANSLMHPLTADVWEACQGTDAILYSILGFYPAYSVAQKLQVRSYGVYVQPQTPTQAFPCYPFPEAPSWLRVGRGTYNRLTHFLREEFFWLALLPAMNRARHDILHLPALPPITPHRRQKLRKPVFYGYSRYVLPRPQDWQASNHITGYWFLPRAEGWQPPQALVDFLASGPPPVYVGFGSMSGRKAREAIDIALRTLTQTGQRGILLTGWAGLSEMALPDTIFPIDTVPHDWLFPQVAAVVHHGGAGTTAAGLRAGRPTITVPFFGDQPFWARQVYKLGVGPAPMPSAQLAVEPLAAAIHTAVTDEGIRSRAAALGSRIRLEDGVETAVRILSHYLVIRTQ